MQSPIYHSKTKHIEVRYHHIRELITDKKLEVRKVDIEVNTTDSLTKLLPNHRFKAIRRQMGLQQAEGNKKTKSEEAE